MDGAVKDCFQMNFRWMVGKMGTRDGTRHAISFLELLPHLLHARCYFIATLIRCSRASYQDELCLLQNGTWLLEAMVPYSAIELICHMTGRHSTRVCLEPASLAHFHKGYFLYECSFRYDQDKKEPSLCPRQIFICWPISKGVFYCFSLSYYFPITFPIQPKSTSYCHKAMTSQVRLYASL